MLRSMPRAMLLFCLTFSLLSVRVSSQASASSDGSPAIAPTPPMGWASWNHFFCDYDEKTIRAQADALVSTGMKDAGYKYVVIQECISSKRDVQGNLIADNERFPSGIPALTAYIHKLGLKAGIYTDIGRNTCYPNPRYEGSYGHEEHDASMFAAWGMDFVEMDYCNRVEEHPGRWVYERMAEAIKRTGRPMIFYLCAWGNEQPWEWAQGNAQMWRTEYDISLEKNHVEWPRMVRNFESNTVHSVLSGPESWNDADMLEIGNPGLNDTEAEAQMSMWAISPSPLLAGADLTQMSKRTREIYMNREVLAINQDPLGAGAEKLPEAQAGLEIWTKSLGSRTGGEYAVMLLNTTDQSHPMEVHWPELDLLSNPGVRDLWLHKDVMRAGEAYQNTVAAHSAVLLRVSGTRAWHRGVVYEAEWPGIRRIGTADLFPCGECSRGYAMAIGGDHKRGSLQVSDVAKTGGEYTLRMAYTRNGLEDKQISVGVNGVETKVTAIMRSWNWIDVPIALRAGANSISISYEGQQSFYLDYVELLRSDSLGNVSKPR